MKAALNIGVDFGSTGMRVAYSQQGRETMLPAVPGVSRPSWLFPDASPSSQIGVSFPSVKAKLGIETMVAVNQRRAAPVDLVCEVFKLARAAVEQASSADVGQAVVCVPALYTSTQRGALREAILAAGFSDVHLINDSVAATTAYAVRVDRPVTTLVYSIGYAGIELGLVRAVRGHYRALGYHGGTIPGGWMVDHTVLTGLMIKLADHVPIDLSRWNAGLILQLRAEAERVKEALSAEPEVSFPLMVQDPGGATTRFTIRFSRAALDGEIRPSIAASLDNAQRLLEQHGIAPSQLDAVLITGRATRAPLVGALIRERFGEAVVTLEPDDVARGAATHAGLLAAMPVASGFEQDKPTEADGFSTPATPAAMRVTIQPGAHAASEGGANPLVLLASPKPGAASAGSDESRPLHHAAALIERGDIERARAILTVLVRDAQDLLARLPAATGGTPASSSNRRAQHAIARSRQLLKARQFEDAVRAAHEAFAFDPDSPDIFEDVIDVHCLAAMEEGVPTRYEDAQRWLLCAHAHDQANARVRHLLAELNYLEAKGLHSRRKRAGALHMIERCLAWEPEHPLGRELQQALLRSQQSA